MTYALVLAGVGLLYLLVRALHLASLSASPTLIFNKSSFNDRVLALCPMLLELYIPPLFWGKSGHLQTILYGKMGRVKSPYPKGERFSNIMQDGATSTFDVFQPLLPHPSGEDLTFAVCPGIANHSESVYIRTFVHNAQMEGYRVAVLNHLGAREDVKLTSPRIYTYGGTDEYGAMICRLKKTYENTTLIGVGFSMGGNILCKYLAESRENQENILCGISCCQGYNCTTTMKHLQKWEHLRRVYLYVMTLHQKHILNSHKEILFGHESQKLHGKFDLQAIFSSTCTSFRHLDELYSRRRAGFDDLESYYKWSSCSEVINNIHLPMLLLNAKDDPLCPEPVLEPAKQFALARDNVIFCLTDHGGHLGYFEGNLLIPETITWMDKVIVQYANAVIKTHNAAGSQAV